LIAFLSCSKSENIVNSVAYEGKSLEIGVIGEITKVRESQVNFEAIDYLTFKDNKFNFIYDGIIIMKEQLLKASEKEYARIYKESSIPFFFIGFDKSYIPFIEGNIDYESADLIENSSYAIGFFVLGKEMTNWRYGLYNDLKNKRNIDDIYTRIFKSIESSMSSVPGLPLNISIKEGQGNNKIEYLWQAEQGEFLSWKTSSDKIKLLDNVSTVTNDTIYWRPGVLQGNDTIRLIVDIKNIEENKIIGRKTIEVYSNDNTMYSLKLNY